MLIWKSSHRVITKPLLSPVNVLPMGHLHDNADCDENEYEECGSPALLLKVDDDDITDCDLINLIKLVDNDDSDGEDD